jgi:hypothetical protein
MKKMMLMILALNLISSAFAITHVSMEELTTQGALTQDDYGLPGTGYDNSDMLFEASISFVAVPEPCTLLLCGGGAAFLFGIVRKK